MAPARWLGGRPWMTEPAAKAAALVVVTTIRLVLAVAPPPTGPAKLA